jgi:hypothetical protein
MTLRAAGLGVMLQLCLPTPSPATDGPASTGASYLKLPLGAHSIAMGETKAALIADPYSWLANPGALQGLKGSGVGAFHSEWMLENRYDNLMGYHRFNKRFIAGAALTYSYRPDIQGYDDLGSETEMLKSNNYQIVIGVGYSPVRALTFGLNAKYFRETLANWSAGGPGFDLGALYTVAAARTSFGLAVEHLGPSVTFDKSGEPLPVTVRFGVSSTLAPRRHVVEVTGAADVVKPRFEDAYLTVGLSLDLYRCFAVRIGYCGQAHRSGDGLTMGAGATVGRRITADYAAAPYGDLGTIHTISLYFHL